MPIPNASFGTVVTCMDGRIQLCVNRYLVQRWGVEFIDTVTEAGPDRIVAEGSPRELLDSILERVKISVERHGSRHLALIGHDDCAGNPCDEATHRLLIRNGMRRLADRFPGTTVVGLWVGVDGSVSEITLDE